MFVHLAYTGSKLKMDHGIKLVLHKTQQRVYIKNNGYKSLTQLETEQIDIKFEIISLFVLFCLCVFFFTLYTDTISQSSVIYNICKVILYLECICQ